MTPIILALVVIVVAGGAALFLDRHRDRPLRMSQAWLDRQRKDDA